MRSPPTYMKHLTSGSNQKLHTCTGTGCLRSLGRGIPAIAHQREWKSASWDRKSSKKEKTTVHQASAEEQLRSLRAAPTAVYTALLQVLLCTACAVAEGTFRCVSMPLQGCGPARTAGQRLPDDTVLTLVRLQQNISVPK